MLIKANKDVIYFLTLYILVRKILFIFKRLLNINLFCYLIDLILEIKQFE
jgi:hypothetical protein